MNEDLFLRGHYLFNDNVVDGIPQKIVGKKWYKLGDCNFLDLDQNDKYFLKISNYIGQKYVSKILNSYRIVDFCLWNGVDPETEVWHTDDKVGYDFSFLCYLNDLTKQTGGSISFRNVNEKEKKYEIYPKKNDIVIMNHSSSWEHIVEQMKPGYDRFVFHIGYSK
jgi:hypothetical protein